MKRFTFLLTALLTISSAINAQRVPEQNAFLVHTFSGTVSSAQAYEDGVMWIGNDGTNDVIGYSSDGISFSTLENLEDGSASRLSTWSGSGLGFFYGNKTSDGAGIDLRVNDNGTGRLLWDQSDGHDPSFPALTNVLRVDQGSDGYRYYYIAQGILDNITGYEATIYETDGTDFGTIEVEKELTNANPFDPNQRISVKLSQRNAAGILDGVMFNDKLHFITGTEATNGMYSSLCYIDYDSNGSTVRFLAKGDNEVLEWSNLVATDTYLYTSFWYDNNGIGERGGMQAIDAAGQVSIVNNGSVLTFTNDKPIVANNKVYAITEASFSGVKKLAVINSPTDVDIYHINAEAETDNVSNLVVSGNKLYFWASQTGSDKYYLYVLRLDQDGAQPVEASSVYEGQDITAMVALEDGSVAYSHLNSLGSAASVTEGFNGTAYAAVDEDKIDYTFTYSWNGEIVEIIAQGNELFYFVETTDEVTSDPKVKIYQLSHVPAEATKPSPLPTTTFYRGNYIFNVTDSETSNPIEGASVTIRQKALLLDEMSASTNTSGQAFYAWKPITYYHFTVSAVGYETVEYDEWATIWMPDELYNAFGTRDVQLTPDGSTAIGDIAEGAIQLYPNPVSDIINLKSDISITSVELYSLAGNKVMEVRNQNISSIDVANIPAGIYVVIVTDTNGRRETIKVTKH
ncbi:T9SS type A sorting domain-containing protein [Carboxylicivirga sp. N1Y90]|uniref:T9SS type A sorting domain-containing protein n=1 Tax=Carboxylicivirga fragile TaxID=3417571 RepID=UPI003D336D20|nr:T9SS type A sorting domain-containing protein [Marinilabiliaceae bacterium N1Y90]